MARNGSGVSRPSLIPQSVKDEIALRDWFAGLAMQGMNANPDLLEIVTSGGILDGSYFEKAAKKAYAQADAMLRARTPD